MLGLPETQVRIIVDSIHDWRSQGNYPRLNGAKNAYYLSLDPPYVAKNGKFETVEELAWVRGFEASPLIPHLSRWLTACPHRKRDQPQYGPFGGIDGHGICP